MTPLHKSSLFVYTVMVITFLSRPVSSAEVLSPAKILRGHDTWVNDIALFGSSLYSVSNDGSLIEWDLVSGKIIKKIHLDKIKMLVREVVPNVYTIAISESGKFYGITASDGFLRIRNRITHEEIWKYRIKLENAYSLNFTDDKRLLIGDIAGTVTMVDIEAKKELYEIDAHVDAINEIAISPDKKRFVTVSNDSLVRIWDLESGKRIKTLKGHKDSVLSVAFSPDGKQLITGSRDRMVMLWDIEKGESTVIHRDFSYVNEVAFSTDGSMVAYQDHIQDVTIKNVEYERVLFKLKGHESNIRNIIFSSDSGKVYTCGTDSNIMIWNLRREE